jgi:opacity protein-like surface antigen
MMVKKLTCFILALASITSALAQKRIEFGGNLGLQFGTVTIVNISPSVGYWFTNYLMGGLELTYLYSHDSREGGYKGSTYGIDILGKVYPYHNFYLEANYSNLNTGLPSIGPVKERIWTRAFLIGGGYSQQLSQNVFLNFSILWDVIGEEWYPFNNPLIRAGIVTRL